MGVQQGRSLSLMSFGLYVDALEEELASHQLTPYWPSLAGRRLRALLYAYDLAYVSKARTGLQAQLFALQGYAAK